LFFVGCDVITAVNMKTSIFRDIKPSSPKSEKLCLPPASFQFYVLLISDPEDGSDMFLVNVG
jgi:hypothetical protein